MVHNIMENNDLSASLEDYLEAVYQISKRKTVVHANRIAEYLHVGKSSVSWALNQLSQKGLINYTPYEAVTLTPKGQNLGKRLAQRHGEIKNFLTEVLSINESIAEANACRMEHVLDKEILQRMRQFMEFLNNCPRAGRQWMKGFGYFCDYGRLKENCKSCLSECLEKLPPASNIPSLLSEELPKRSKQRDHLALQRLKEVLAESGRELTSEQAEVIEFFMSADRHLPLESIYQQTHQANNLIRRETVNQALDLLCEHQIARPLRFRDQIVYEHYHPESHHDHLFCVKCGGIVEFFDPRIESLQVENARRADFRLLMHSLNIYGVCHECIKKQSFLRSLDECLAGEAVEVVRIDTDSQSRNRLADMGLAVGSILEILNDQCQGNNVIVMLGAVRLMLDNEIIRKIKVIPVDTERFAALPHRRRARHRHRTDRMDAYGQGVAE